MKKSLNDELKEKAKHFAKFLVTKEFSEPKGTIVVTTDDAPDYVRNLVYACHDGNLPDDWTYETVSEILDLFDEYDDIEDISSDLSSDIYDSDLLDWMRSCRRSYLVDETIEEMGKADTLMNDIMNAQIREKNRIFYEIKSFLEDFELDEMEVSDDEN